MTRFAGFALMAMLILGASEADADPVLIPWPVADFDSYDVSFAPLLANVLTIESGGSLAPIFHSHEDPVTMSVFLRTVGGGYAVVFSHTLAGGEALTLDFPIQFTSRSVDSIRIDSSVAQASSFHYFGATVFDTIPTSPPGAVPEPSSIVLFGAGLITALATRRRLAGTRRRPDLNGQNARRRSLRGFVRRVRTGR